ncbi:MAG: hypothetical protein EAZ91_24800 [Cytophagales bacterium]|nr:MAG: hypothetical protein EAZ91_24800 [Cytophagales bacterium]
MINITRSEKVPDSLNKPAIRQHLDDLDAYHYNQQLPPAEQHSLKKPECAQSYRNADLFEAFDECFFSKCYLTEKAFVTSYSMDVEHFVPRNERPDLTYKWENLYPADHDANMIKPWKTPSGGYLDPCDLQDDVEKELLYFLDFEGNKVNFKARDRTNEKAINTAKLLQKLHNGDSGDSKQKTLELRNAIKTKYVEVLNTIIRWRKACQEQNQEEEFKNECLLKGYLSRESAFTMIMRSVDAVKDLPSDFFD